MLHQVRFLFMTLLVLLLAGSPATPGSEPAAQQRRLAGELSKYLDAGGVVVADDTAVLFSHHGGVPLVPASTLKLATALAAFHYLGAEYRYKTELYSGPAGDLTIRGYGDPFLVSEEWALVVQELADSGALPDVIRNIYLDTSAFSSEIMIPGIEPTTNPYDARNGALVANFNTIFVDVGSGGRVRSAEPQTPLTPLARAFGARLRPGQHRINISQSPDSVPHYAGQLVREFLKERGYEILGTVAVRRAGDEDRLILTHHNSRSLEEMVAAMMEYSNNFVANQLLLTLGLERGGEPATLGKGAAFLEQFLLQEVGLDRAELEIVEGSGISFDNHLTPIALAKIVRAFYPYRRLLTTQDGILLKTGTLEGAYALAGYLPAERPVYFAIMLNQPRNTRDQILALLAREGWSGD